MQMPSETLPEVQDLTPTKLDLSAIANEHPVNLRTMVLDLNTFDASQLTLLEVLDMAEAVDVPPEALGSLMSGKQNAKRMKLLYALAWCLARRADAMLTLEEVITWKLEIIGEVKPGTAERSAKRAATIVNAARVSGLKPSDAQDLTVAQLSAYTGANRAARRRRK